MKRIAVTFEHNHSTLTDIWSKYYKPFFDELRIVKVGDLLATDWGGTTKYLNSLQEELFKDYDLILFADVDEIVIPNPDKYKDLGEYLDKFDKEAIRCVGYNVIEMDNDKPIDFTKPLIEQRTYWSRDNLYDKCVIITKPQHYVSNHAVANKVEQDPDLILLHLRDMDLTSTIERNKKIGHEFNMRDFANRRTQASVMPLKWRVL